MTRRRGYGVPATDLPLLLLLLSAGLAVWPAHDRAASLPSLAAMAAGLALYLALSRVRAGGRLWHAAAGATVAAASFFALYFVTHYGRLGYPEKIPFLDSMAALIGRLTPLLGRWAPDRNSVGTALAGIVFLAAGLAATERRRSVRVVWAGAAAIVAAGLVLSASRGAWLGVVVAALVWFVVERPWFGPRPRAAALVYALPMLVGLGWLAAVVWWPEATGTGAISPALDRPDRVTLYRQSAFLIGDYPYTGIGFGGQFAMQLSKYALLIQVPYLTYSHNLYLETWLELGPIGILALAWLLAALGASLLALPQLRNRTLAVATAAGLLAMFLHGVVDARPYVDLWSGLPLFVLLGLHAALVRPAQTGPLKRLARLWSAGLVTTLLALVAMANWPLDAAWYANIGALRQAQSELVQGGQTAAAAPRPHGAGLTDAEASFRRALATDPGNRTASLRLALIEMADGRFDAAAGHAAVAWKADPASLTTRKAFGLACVWTGDLRRAQPLLQGVPGIVDELNSWGWWRSSRGETRLATDALRMSLLLEPDQHGVRDLLLRLR